jgi:membrane fusion protein, macrolide-specific efflux system
VHVRTRPRTRGATRWLLVLAAVVVVVAASGVAWATTRSSSDSAEPTLAKVSAGTFSQTVSASGTIVPAHQEDLSFTVAGEVSSVLVAEGDPVRKGQRLAQIGKDALRADVTAARSTLTAARTQLSSDQGADVSEAQLAADQASVSSAKTALAVAKEALADATLRSPIAGVVASVDLTVGEQVSGSGGGGSADPDDSNGATSQVTVMSTGAYVVEASVGSSDLAQLKKGLQAEITPTGATETVYGIVATIGMVASTSSSGAATFPVTIDVTGSPEGLYAGSTADVSIIVKKETDVLTVPSRALHTSGSTTFVYKLVGGKRVKTTVTLGAAYGAQTEVTSGLTAGDQVELPAFVRPEGGLTGDTGGNLENRFPDGPPGGGQVPADGGFLGGGQ